MDEWKSEGSQANARSAIRKLVEEWKLEHGYQSNKEVAINVLKWGPGSLSQAMNGTVVVGNTALLKFMKAGIDPGRILPEHPYSKRLEKNAGTEDELSKVVADFDLTPELPELPLDCEKIQAYLCRRSEPETRKFALVNQQALRPDTFCIRMPDNALGDPGSTPRLPEGYIVFFDPHRKPKKGDAVLAVTSNDEALIRAYKNSRTLHSTVTGFGGNISSFTVLAVAYYCVMDI